MAGSLVFGAATTDIASMGTITQAANLNPFTILVWCYPTTFTSNRILFSKGGGTTKGFRLSGTAGDIQGVVLRATTNCTIASTNLPLALNTRCFIAFTFDSAAGGGLVGRLYSGRVGTPATECTYNGANVDGTGAVNDDTIVPNLAWGNNSAASPITPIQGEISHAAYFPGVLTLAQIQSWQLNPRAVVGSIAAVSYVEFGTNGATAIDYAGNAAGTVVGATVGSNITGITSKVAANVALVAAMGYTDAQAFDIKDARLSIKSDRTTWTDAISPTSTVNGRVQGIALAASNVPTIAAEGVVFDGVNDIFTSPQDTRLVFDAATALHYLAVVKVSGNGPVLGAAQDPTNNALYPHGYLQGAGGFIKGSWNPTGAGTGQIQPDSHLATGATIRAALVGRYARDGGTTSGDDGWHFGVFGQQAQTIPKNTAATTVGGGLKEFMGGFGGAFCSCTVYHKMTIAADLTPAAMAAYGAWAVAEFGATLDNAGAGSFIVLSHSWGAATQTTDPLSPSIGTGTTGFANLVGTTATSKGTIKSKFGLVENKQWIASVGGRTIDAARVQYAHESALVLDGFRTGPKIALVLFWTNDERTLGLTLAQMKTAAAAYYTVLAAAGWTVVLCNAPPYGSPLGGAPNGCYANASPDPTIGTEGVVMQGMNTELVANPSPYGHRHIVLTTTTGFRYSPRDTADTTNWNVDETHPKDAGHVILTNIILNAIVASGTIWPAGTFYRRRRR